MHRSPWTVPACSLIVVLSFLLRGEGAAPAVGAPAPAFQAQGGAAVPGTMRATPCGIAVCAEVYPETWGAVGDGVTDDAAALQSAIDFVAGASEPFTLRLWRKYALASPILFTGRDYQVVGNGSESGLVWTGPTAATAVGIGDGVSVTLNLRFRDFAFEDGSGGVDQLVHINYCTRSRFDGLTFVGADTATNGVLLAHEFSWINDFESPRFYGGFIGLELRENSNGVTFYGASLEHQTSIGIWVAWGNLLNRVNFLGGTIEGTSSGHGILVQHPSGSLSIQGMYFENNGQHIEFNHNPAWTGTSVTIRDCRFHSGGGVAAIELATAQRIFCRNNSFRTQPLVHVNFASDSNDDAVYVGWNNTTLDGSAEVVLSQGMVFRHSTDESGEALESYGSSLAPAAVTLNGHPIPEIEHGTSATVPAGGSLAVSFPRPFSGPPTVVAGHESAAAMDGVVRVSNVTAAGFTAHNDATVPTTVSYIATHSP